MAANFKRLGMIALGAGALVAVQLGLMPDAEAARRFFGNSL